MFSSYYLTHPSLPLTAVVEAPATEKARTTFLDYLERSGIIHRRDRKQVRKGIMTKLLSPEDQVPADIYLSYGYVASGPRFIPSPPAQVVEPQSLPVEEGPVVKRSPLVNASLGGMV